MSTPTNLMGNDKDTHFLYPFLCFCYEITKSLLLLINKYIAVNHGGFATVSCECKQDYLLCVENIGRVSSLSPISSATALRATTDGPKNDLDTSSPELFGMSPLALQNVRKQMALSLERTKELEDQVKQIPELKVSLLYRFRIFIYFSKYIQFLGRL